MPKGYWLATY